MRDFGFFSRVVTSRITASILAALVGLLFILMPDKCLDLFCLFGGIALLIAALAFLISFINVRRVSDASLIYAVVLALSGLLCLIKPELVQGLLGLVFGFFLIVEAIRLLVDGLDCARAKTKVWSVIVIFSLAILVLGVIVLFGKFEAILVFSGIAMLTDGVLQLFCLLFFGRRIKMARPIMPPMPVIPPTADKE